MVKKRLFTGRFLLVNLREQLIKPLLRCFLWPETLLRNKPYFCGTFLLKHQANTPATFWKRDGL